MLMRPKNSKLHSFTIKKLNTGKNVTNILHVLNASHK